MKNNKLSRTQYICIWLILTLILTSVLVFSIFIVMTVILALNTFVKYIIFIALISAVISGAFVTLVLWLTKDFTAQQNADAVKVIKEDGLLPGIFLMFDIHKRTHLDKDGKRLGEE